MSGCKRLHVFFSGRVQGVFFRAFTREVALRHGVKGWVRNLPDGRVEAVLEGPRDAVYAVLEACKEGPPMARVEGVEIVEEVCQQEFDGFEIRP